MDYKEVMDLFDKNIEKGINCDVRIWVGLDGIFKDTDYPDDNDELICCCSISCSGDTGSWIVTPWLYNEDCGAIFEKSSSARTMALFWMNWMDKIYGDGLSESEFEADWLAIKSNRTLLTMLFKQGGETLKRKLWHEEGKDVDDYIMDNSGSSLICPIDDKE